MTAAVESAPSARSADARAFRSEVDALAARTPAWEGRDRSLRFLAEVARRIAPALRDSAFLRVNRQAISLNIGNYWLAEVRPGRVCFLATGAHPLGRGWATVYRSGTIDAVLLAAEAPQPLSEALWADHALASLLAAEGPQGRLNSHPRKERFAVSVLESFRG